MIDARLLDGNGEAETAENFNRVLALVDALEARIHDLENPV